MADNQSMLRITRLRRFSLCIAALLGLLILAGCRTAGGSRKWSEEEKEILRLEQLLALTADELSLRSAQNQSAREELSVLEARVAELEETIQSRTLELVTTTQTRDEELDALRDERDAILLDLQHLASAAELAAAQAANAEQATEEALRRAVAAETAAAEAAELSAELKAQIPEPEPEPAQDRTAAALADALGGLGGFRSVSSFGFQRDSRMTSRLGVVETGLAVDTGGPEPVLYDPSLSFDTSLVYLTIANPAGDDPTLLLTSQYVSDMRPLFAQTAFISIENADPIDPVDPVIFTGYPERDTDGTRVREAFTREVDRALLNRLAAMLSSSGFNSTFVGGSGRESHAPGLAEREAMSRVLFAFIDLGGYR